MLSLDVVLQGIESFACPIRPSWQVISRADFITTVVNFPTDSLTNAVIRTVEDVFKAAGDLTADTVMRASKACGPLYTVRIRR